MEKRQAIYEGKAKIIYTTDDPNQVIQYFKDDATAFNAEKRGTIKEKGIMNNGISEVLFRLLEDQGVPTHFVKRLNDREMLVRRLDIIPVEVVMRNVIAGSLAKRFGKEEGGSLSIPVLEHYYKSDPLGDPMINLFHIRALDMADEICPDTCRLWEKGTLEKLDKDRFRRDLGKVEEAYQEVCRRVCG
jgi:phosphoribosylaminoimidazole-succinocarboxamide synthase